MRVRYNRMRNLRCHMSKFSLRVNILVIRLLYVLSIDLNMYLFFDSAYETIISNKVNTLSSSE